MKPEEAEDQEVQKNDMQKPVGQNPTEQNLAENDPAWATLEEYLGGAANTLSKLFSLQPPPNIPKASDFKKEFVKELHPSISRLQKGMSLLLEFLVTPETPDPHLVSAEFTEQLCQLAAIASVFAQHPEQYLTIVSSGKTLQEAFELDDEGLERLYGAAKYIYEQQHYSESGAAFSVLTLLSPNNHTFWIGLANSEYFCRNFEHALVAYAMAAHCNPHDPLCHLFSSHCYESMGQKQLALNALDLALVSIGEQEHYATWRQKIIEQKARLAKK